MRTLSICGNVGKDAEVRDAGSTKVLSFSVAVNTKIKDVEKTLWFDVSSFGDKIGGLQQYIRKGDKIAVTGELDTHENNGKTYLKVRAFVGGITLIGKTEKRDNGGSSSKEGDTSFNHGANEEPSF